MDEQIRQRLIEKGARALYNVEDFDGLHPEDQEAARDGAAAVVDALLIEQVGWAVLKEGVTSWRRIEEGTTGGGSQFWRDAAPVFTIRAAEEDTP